MSIVRSLEALPIILEDRPFEAVEAKVEGDLDTFVEELNEVLTFDRGVLKEREITTTPVNI